MCIGDELPAEVGREDLAALAVDEQWCRRVECGGSRRSSAAYSASSTMRWNRASPLTTALPTGSRPHAASAVMSVSAIGVAEPQARPDLGRRRRHHRGGEERRDANGLERVVEHRMQAREGLLGLREVPGCRVLDVAVRALDDLPRRLDRTGVVQHVHPRREGRGQALGDRDELVVVRLCARRTAAARPRRSTCRPC